MLAREQEIQECGERELLAGFGCGRRCLTVEQRARELRLIIERHARARHAGVRANASRECEVEQNDAVVPAGENVSRMDVAMHDATGV